MVQPMQYGPKVPLRQEPTTYDLSVADMGISMGPTDRVTTFSERPIADLRFRPARARRDRIAEFFTKRGATL